jgi:hypothetical protein
MGIVLRQFTAAPIVATAGVLEPIFGGLARLPACAARRRSPPTRPFWHGFGLHSALGSVASVFPAAKCPLSRDKTFADAVAGAATPAIEGAVAATFESSPIRRSADNGVSGLVPGGSQR